MKAFFAFGIAALIATAAAAQTQPTAPPAPPPAEYTLKVDQNDLSALAAAINELPKKIADPLLAKLNAQLQAQSPAKAADQAPAGLDKSPEKSGDPKSKK